MKDKLQMILFVLILGSILTTALVVVDNITAGPIARNKAIKLQKAILSSLGVEYDEKNLEDIDAKFTSGVETIVKEEAAEDGKEPAKVNFYRSNASKDVAFEINGTGVQGAIRGMIALTPDMKRISGLRIVEQEETPGLGGRIAEAEFLSRFNGKDVTGDVLILPPGKSTDENVVDGITGATLSCNALQEMLNKEIKKYLVIFRNSQ